MPHGQKQVRYTLMDIYTDDGRIKGQFEKAADSTAAPAHKFLDELDPPTPTMKPVYYAACILGQDDLTGAAAEPAGRWQHS